MRELLEKLADQSGGLDARQEWPASQFSLLGQQGILGWVIPREFGGTAVGEISTRSMPASRAILIAVTVSTVPWLRPV